VNERRGTEDCRLVGDWNVGESFSGSGEDERENAPNILSAEDVLYGGGN
jgi:hypothetical protein